MEPRATRNQDDKRDSAFNLPKKSPDTSTETRPNKVSFETALRLGQVLDNQFGKIDIEMTVSKPDRRFYSAAISPRQNKKSLRPTVFCKDGGFLQLGHRRLKLSQDKNARKLKIKPTNKPASEQHEAQPLKGTKKVNQDSQRKLVQLNEEETAQSNTFTRLSQGSTTVKSSNILKSSNIYQLGVRKDSQNSDQKHPFSNQTNARTQPSMLIPQDPNGFQLTPLFSGKKLNQDSQIFASQNEAFQKMKQIRKQLMSAHPSNVRSPSVLINQFATHLLQSPTEQSLRKNRCRQSFQSADRLIFTQSGPIYFDNNAALSDNFSSTNEQKPVAKPRLLNTGSTMIRTRRLVRKSASNCPQKQHSRSPNRDLKTKENEQHQNNLNDNVKNAHSRWLKEQPTTKTNSDVNQKATKETRKLKPNNYKMAQTQYLQQLQRVQYRDSGHSDKKLSKPQQPPPRYLQPKSQPIQVKISPSSTMSASQRIGLQEEIASPQKTPPLQGELEQQIDNLKKQLSYQTRLSREQQIANMSALMLQRSELNIQRRKNEMLQNHLIMREVKGPLPSITISSQSDQALEDHS